MLRRQRQIALILAVFVIDHDNPPDQLAFVADAAPLPHVALLRREWDFVFDQLRSTTAVVDYLHRIAPDHIAVGEHVDPTPIQDGLRATLALYVGGMGAKCKNFYNDLAVAYGFDEAAAKIQDLFLGGQRAEAAAAVPQEWLEAICLVGPTSYVGERLAAFRAAGVTQLSVDPVGADPVATLDQVRTLLEA